MNNNDGNVSSDEQNGDWDMHNENGDEGDAGGNSDRENDRGNDGDGNSDVGDDDGNNDVGDGNGDGIGGGDGDIDEDRIEEKMEKCILRIIKSKVQYSWSQQETLQQIRSLYELTNDDHILHQARSYVIKFLKQLGYKQPQHYKVCCGRDHATLVENDRCSDCNTLKKNCLDLDLTWI